MENAGSRSEFSALSLVLLSDKEGKVGERDKSLFFSLSLCNSFSPFSFDHIE
jgi:hypothetical protein